MRVFDCHSDLLCNVAVRRLNGEKNIVKKYHEPQLKTGNIGAILCNIWIDPPYDNTDPTGRMLEILGAMSAELREHGDTFRPVTTADEVEQCWQEGKIAYMLGMEGLSGIKGKLIFLETLYQLGVRQAMLTWNEANELATGAGISDNTKGLTELGKDAVRYMEELGIIVDLSHTNEKSFWDIANMATKPFIASHSNVYTLCPVARNLKDDQLKAIGNSGGVVGLNAWSDFIDPVTENKTTQRLADHVDYMADLIGIDHIACGFDFCEYLGGAAMSFAGGDKHDIAIGLEDTTKVPAFFDILANRGYTASDLEKIAYKNFLRILRSVSK